MSIREEIEKREKASLSPFAKKSSESKGRERKEEECPYRTAFQRDRDKIIHCKSFRRLKHKTQVFLSPAEDHYRTRLTHTLEVSQIARTLARALRLNEDLTEAIALGHDLGHTPFGHAGEDVINDILKGYGKSFKHNEQSVRVVTVLEKDGKGLNLTEEVIDGIMNHPQTGPWPKTLEGCLVRHSDHFAYIRHDIEDALRAGVIKEKDLPKKAHSLLGKHILDTVVPDVIKNSLNQPELKMSPEVHEAVEEMYAFLYEKVYTNPFAKREESKVPDMLRLLFRHYLYNPEKLPGYTKGLKEDELLQKVVDFVAGMTDRYAINKFEELFVPSEWRREAS